MENALLFRERAAIVLAHFDFSPLLLLTSSLGLLFVMPRKDRLLVAFVLGYKRRVAYWPISIS